MNKSFWLHMGLILFFGGELVITMVQAAPTSYPQVLDNLPENPQAPKD